MATALSLGLLVPPISANNKFKNASTESGSIVKEQNSDSKNFSKNKKTSKSNSETKKRIIIDATVTLGFLALIGFIYREDISNAYKRHQMAAWLRKAINNSDWNSTYKDSGLHPLQAAIILANSDAVHQILEHAQDPQIRQQLAETTPNGINVMAQTTLDCMLQNKKQPVHVELHYILRDLQNHGVNVCCGYTQEWGVSLIAYIHLAGSRVADITRYNILHSFLRSGYQLTLGDMNYLRNRIQTLQPRNYISEGHIQTFINTLTSEGVSLNVAAGEEQTTLRDLAESKNLFVYHQ